MSIMTYKQKIKYYKWDNKNTKELFQSIHKLINIRSLQFYMPFFSLYFYIHNKPKSNQKIDLQRNYYLQKIKKITKERYYNSNMFLIGDIYDSSKNKIEEKELFCKCISITDAMHCINNNYNFVIKNNYHLPSAYNYNTFKKINDMNNTAYIDVFCSFLFSQLTYYKKNPSFPLYYGSVNGIGEYKYDITDDYQDIKIDKCFNKMINKAFTLDMYISDGESTNEESTNEESTDEESTDEELTNEESINEESINEELTNEESINEESINEELTDEESINEESKSSKSSSFKSYSDDDYIVKIKNIPIQYLFIEKLKETLEYLIDENIDEEVLISCFFQISFALIYLQKHFKFTHNDLHINNIMYTETETKYLYYKYNNIYYRVPTYGKIFKIIDFGRAIFTYHNKIFMNDVFSHYGEAGGQYTYPSQVDFMNCKNKEIIKPNYNFDLCRLSMTILEELNIEKYSDNFIDFLQKMCLNHVNESFCELKDDFRLYINIAKDACNSLPREIIMNDIFKQYRIKKKLFPRKSFYTI